MGLSGEIWSWAPPGFDAIHIAFAYMSSALIIIHNYAKHNIKRHNARAGSRVSCDGVQLGRGGEMSGCRWSSGLGWRSCLVLALGLAAASGCAGSGAPAAVATPGSYAEVNGIRMYYVVKGAGPVLVLLHGGAGNGEQFSHQVPAFEKRFQLVVPDMCAQGRTTDRDGPLTYHAMAEDVIALMDRLGVKRFD